LLNAGRELDSKVLETVENRNLRTESETVPTSEEIRGAIKKLKSNKASGADEIRAELFKAGGEVIEVWLSRLLRLIWIQRKVPEEWLRAIIIPLFKKGARNKCENWRGISLLCIACKILAQVILTRVVNIVDKHLDEAQAGFRKGRGCVDQIFCLRSIAEKTRDKCLQLWLCFIDLKAAYDTVNREGLWKILGEYGISKHLIELIEAMYQGTVAQVKMDNELSQEFKIKTGLRQGCLLSPCLFNIYMDYVVKITLKDLMDMGVKIKYRMPDGRSRDGTLVAGEEMVSILMYADDIVIMCQDAAVLQLALEKLEKITQEWGLTISVSKTKAMVMQQEKSVEQQLKIREEKIEPVDGFTYLGSFFSDQVSCELEIRRRIGFATGKFFSLNSTVWKQRGLGLKTKIRIYSATVISLLLYGAETWTCDQATYDKLDAFNTKKLRYILGKNRDEMSNKEIYKITNTIPISEMIRERRMRWAGHIRRMDDARLPKKLMFGEVEGGRRTRGRPKLTWDKCFEKDCEARGVVNWKATEKNRLEWKKVVTSRTSRSGGKRN
jgi:hypothetical protein